METEMIEGGIELIDAIAPLWSKLNLHHAAVSPDFAEDFRLFSFEDRRASLTEKAKNNPMRIVMYTESGRSLGYCIASSEGKEGEIDSIYVEEECRNRGVGNRLMTRCMNWLEKQNVTRIKVGVVIGNEDAHAFYRKFGLLPRMTYLTTQKWHSAGKSSSVHKT